MGRRRAGKAKENAETTSGRGTEDVQRSSTSVFGEYSNEEIIAQLRGIAMDPMGEFVQNINIQPLCNMIRGLRKFRAAEEFEMPWKKRKFEQLVRDELPKPQNEAESSRRRSQPSPSSHVLNATDSAQNESLNHSTPNRSRNSGIRHVNRLLKKAVPFGPRFQAEVPEWDDSALIGAYNSDPDNSKWLGSRDWPSETGTAKSTDRRIGKGRLNSCTCSSQGSADCIKRHIVGERSRLQNELGPVFDHWRFGEMGEQVSESWSLQEQRAFESVMEMRPCFQNAKKFWIHVLKAFRGKPRKDIAGYYFNVYIVRRMSTKQVDSDDEEETDEAWAENVKYLSSR